MLFKRRFGRYGVKRDRHHGFFSGLWHEGKNHYTWAHVFETGEDGMTIAQKRRYEAAYGALGAASETEKAALQRQLAEAQERAAKHRKLMLYGGGALALFAAYRYAGPRKNPGEILGGRYSSKEGLDVTFSAENYVKSLMGIGAVSLGAASFVTPLPGGRVLGTALLVGGLLPFDIDITEKVTGVPLLDAPSAIAKKVTGS